MVELTQGQVNRLTLAKHGLLERGGGNVVAWAGLLCGLHAQVSTTPALTLLARLRSFQPGDLDRALRRKRLVKRWLMRGTLHIVPSAELPTYHQALRRAWIESLGRFLDRQGLPPREERLRIIYPRVIEVLREGPLLRMELQERVRERLPLEYQGGEGFSGWGGSLKEMAYEGLLVHGPTEAGDVALASVEQWLANLDLTSVDEDRALELLATHYFSTYGPATTQDLAQWSGIPLRILRPSLRRVLGTLEEVSVVGQPGRLWTPRGDLRLLPKVEDLDPPGRFLPRFDVLLLGYRDRSRILDPTFARRVVSTTGQVDATVLVKGRIVATWGSLRRGKDLIVNLRPFRSLPPGTLRALTREVDTLRGFYGAQGTKLVVGS